jgi:hypothetical protein
VSDCRSSDPAVAPITEGMGRSVIGLCAGFGMFVGGYVPVVLWHAGDFSLSSLLFGALGGAAGVWFGARLSED